METECFSGVEEKRPTAIIVAESRKEDKLLKLSTSQGMQLNEKSKQKKAFSLRGGGSLRIHVG